MTPLTVLFTPLGFNLAEVTRMIEVARHLPTPVRAVFLTHEHEFRRHITDAGFDLLPGGTALTPREQAQVMAVDQERGIRLPFTVDLLDSRVRAERVAVHTSGAVAMVHGTNPTSVISARAEGIPLFYPVPFALSRPFLTGGAVMPVLQPSPVGRPLNRALSGLAGWGFTRAPLVPRCAAEVARRHGAPPPRTAADLFGADITLLTATEAELDGATLPADHQRVGPIFAHLPGEVPDLVHDLAAGPEPVVYLACGSSGSRRLVLDAARQLGGLPVRVIAPVRAFLTAADITGLPANVHVTDLLPAHRLGGLVDVAVLHGGQGTVQTACATGVPFVGIGLQSEQRWNVDVCVRRGHATALSARRVRTPAFPRALHHVLTDPGVRATAQQVAHEYAGENGAARAAEIIADHVAGRAQASGGGAV